MDNKKILYTLKTIATGRIFEDSGWVIDDKECSTPSLVRAIYAKKQIEVGSKEEGIYRFADWLPINHKLKGSCPPITYKSEHLAKYLGLENLYITFSGYFPEKGALMSTCSFKETEAYSVCGRLSTTEKKTLVVSSAGNTARAFAKVCSENNIPLVICVPEDNLDALWFEKPLNKCVRLYSTKTGTDYFDAIHLGNVIAEKEGYVGEGGAKNIARRDGMGTTMLSATHFIGAIPDYYFQAVGSGTGAISAWEANLRLLEDGRFGTTKTKMILSQNAPFLPMYNAWKKDSRALLNYDDNVARHDVEIIDAKVLSNRKPPYSLAGGLYDALKDCGGDILDIDNEDGRKANILFQKLEGIDLHPAAAIAVASLIQSANNGLIEKDAKIMINITGGGEERMKQNKDLFYLKPLHIFPANVTKEEVDSVL